ncbi:hypothetical protein [Massilibacteroides sp.]|uniref:hypothetical protein n=1 Tax=Massilibacteroides sp. TaxID=2034766 RepID=UPI0026241F52|nr:hypothetical protein [Massilibacteroides sp.]MDD4515630.1 hypothetical protein [Massilibacteroides sp.]
MKHIKKLFELIAALVLSAVLFPIALIYNVIIGFKKLDQFIWLFVIEIFQLIFDVFEKLAVIIDRLGNVILGNMFCRFFVFKPFRDKTLFFNSEVTISASFGHLQKHGFLNKKGERFRKLLDKVFGKNHCLNAFEFDNLKNMYNNSTGIS